MLTASVRFTFGCGKGEREMVGGGKGDDDDAPKAKVVMVADKISFLSFPSFRILVITVTRETTEISVKIEKSWREKERGLLLLQFLFENGRRVGFVVLFWRTQKEHFPSFLWMSSRVTQNEKGKKVRDLRESWLRVRRRIWASICSAENVCEDKKQKLEREMVVQIRVIKWAGKKGEKESADCKQNQPVLQCLSLVTNYTDPFFPLHFFSLLFLSSLAQIFLLLVLSVKFVSFKLRLNEQLYIQRGKRETEKSVLKGLPYKQDQPWNAIKFCSLIPSPSSSSSSLSPLSSSLISPSFFHPFLLLPDFSLQLFHLHPLVLKQHLSSSLLPYYCCCLLKNDSFLPLHHSLSIFPPLYLSSLWDSHSLEVGSSKRWKK